MPIHYPIKIKPQPTESSCGATALQAVYAHSGHKLPLQKIMSEITELKTGGVLGVQLGIHALDQGFKSKIYTHNLRVFDPTWFKLDRDEILKKLSLQIDFNKAEKITISSVLYHEFISKGGEVLLETLTPNLLRELLIANGPIIVGLSSTYLYRSKREYGPDCEYDDVRGEPQGHFVIVMGMSADAQISLIADPHEHNPMAEGQNYSVPTMELIASILIGVITYDANLIIIQKAGAGTP